jgi:predicted Fe-Mo cluster-binding NifX family protein
MTKLAISSEGPTLDDQVDPRFGRAGGFLIVNTDTMETEFLDNGSAQVAPRGAGYQAAKLVADTGAEVVLSGYVGPKAFDALKAAGIQVGQECDKMTVREAVEKFRRGEISLS